MKKAVILCIVVIVLGLGCATQMRGLGNDTNQKQDGSGSTQQSGGVTLSVGVIESVVWLTFVAVIAATYVVTKEAWNGTKRVGGRIWQRRMAVRYTGTERESCTSRIRRAGSNEDDFT